MGIGAQLGLQENFGYIKITKRHTLGDKILQRKLQIEKHEPHLKPGVNSDVPKLS